MAPKKASHLLDDPPSASPSQDHEEEQEEEEEEEEVLEESEEEEESEPTNKTTQIINLTQRSINQPGKESSEEEDWSDTDDGNTKNSPTTSSFIMKPVVNKNSHSMEPEKPTTKRALNDAKGRKDLSKKTKLAKDHLTEEAKGGTTKKAGSAYGRVFSAADDITLLGDMIDYKKQKGVDPRADIGAFFEFVKGNFSFEFTKTQLSEKLRRLKKKFIANLGKGERFIPTKPLDQECFELSKKVFGGDNITGSVGNISGDTKDRVVANEVDHTDSVKIVDAVLVKKKTAKGKSSERKRKERGEKKRESRKNNNNKKKMDDGLEIAEEEAEPVTNEDVVKDQEYVGKDDEDVMKDKEDVGKDDEDVMKDEEDVGKDDEIVLQDMEDVGKDDEHVVKDDEQNIRLKYPNLIASLSICMSDSQRKLMMEGICLVDGQEARELDDRWKKIQIEEIGLYCQKMELMADSSRLLMDALKKKR